VDLDSQRLEAPVADPLITARVPLQVRHSGDLEPDDKCRVVRDPLRIGLSEAHPDVGREREAFHGATLDTISSVSTAAALAALIRERQPCVVLTGAGVSTESGIPDFRSDTGIWAEVDPFEVASIEAFRRDPEKVWGFYRGRIRTLLDADPNAAHQALAELERLGFVRAIVTQNIDTLHSRAGSREVVEVHGSIRSAVCLRCLWTETSDGVLSQLAERPAPVCVHCGEVLKPGVTLFGELLPEGAIERATELARAAELMLVVGSSLEVWPVAGLPLEARAIAIVNRGPTTLDDHALLRIDAPAAQTLSGVLQALA